MTRGWTVFGTVAFGLAALLARADALLWCVGNPDNVDADSYEYARMMVTSTGDTADGLQLAAFARNPATGEWTSNMDWGVIDVVNGKTGWTWADLAGIDTATASFFVELGNAVWDDAGDMTWTTVAVTSRPLSYADVSPFVAMPGLNASDMYVAWDGGPYANVPEPNSALLCALGAALLALRRRRGLHPAGLKAGETK